MPSRTLNAQPLKTYFQVRNELRFVWDAWALQHDDLRERAERLGAVVIGCAYVRESHVNSMQGGSPTAQLRAMLEEAARNQVWVPWERVLLDNESGKTDRRSEFLSMMDAARAKEITHVYVFHSSRIARNVSLAKSAKRELREKLGVSIHQLNLQIDPHTAIGKFVETVQEASDQLHSDSTGEWITNIKRDHIEQGEPQVLAEYLVRQPDRSIGLHPQLAEIIRQGVALYLRNREGADVSFGDVAKWALAQGHRSPSGSVLTADWWRELLEQPTVYGYTAYKAAKHKPSPDQWFKGAFPAVLELADFHAIEAIRAARRKVPGRPAQARTYIVQNGRCSRCGGHITASSKGFMRCRNAQKKRGCEARGFSKESLELEVDQLMSALRITPELRARTAELIERDLGRKVDSQEIDRIQRQLRALSVQHEAELIDDAEMTSRARALKARLAELRLQPSKEIALEALALAGSMAEAWPRMTLEERRDAWAYTVAAVEVHDGVLVSLRPKLETASLFAAQITLDVEASLRRCGPDRIRTGDLVLDRDVC